MQRIAVELQLDPLDVIRRKPDPEPAQFPYRTATLARSTIPAITRRAVELGVSPVSLAELEQSPRRSARRRPALRHRLCRRGRAERLEHGLHHHRADRRGEAKEGRARKTARRRRRPSRSIPVGSVSVHVASTPQGQGHRTVLAQVVAGMSSACRIAMRSGSWPISIPARMPGPIASGNYSSRFAAAVAGAAHLAATRLRDKLALIAAEPARGPSPGRSALPAARSSPRAIPTGQCPFGRDRRALRTGRRRCCPSGVDQTIRETAFWTPPQLTAPSGDRRDQLLALPWLHLRHGRCRGRSGETGKARIDRYVTQLHDCGRVLHPAMVEGQIQRRLRPGCLVRPSTRSSPMPRTAPS